MAENTRLKELLETQKKFDQILQTETMKRATAEGKFHEHLQSIDQKVEEKISSIDAKCDHLTKLMADVQLQLLNMNKSDGNETGSILGKPPKFSRFPKTTGSVTGAYKSKFNSESGQAGHGNSHHRVDFPIFDGSNPRSWVIKCNTYFQLTSVISDEQMVQLAIHHFEGRALQWFQNFGYENILNITWEQFLEVIAARFDDISDAKIIMEFKNLKQTGTYTQYVEKFEELRSCLMLSSHMEYSEDYL